jgi:hypothetical protein
LGTNPKGDIGMADYANTECWKWPGSQQVIKQVRRRLFLNGRKAGKARVTNRCGDPSCINPAHQELVAVQSVSPENLFSLIEKRESGCWEWQGKLLKGGYGYFVTEGKTTLVYRYLFEQQNGVIEKGKQLDHLCRNRACCNPDHLDLVTPKQNRDRGDLAVERTHCPKGHEYTLENTLVNKRGSRECRACKRLKTERELAAEKEQRRAEGCKPASAERTHCPAGHEYTLENTGIVTKTRERYCKECHRTRAKARYYKDLEANRAKARERQRGYRKL